MLEIFSGKWRNHPWIFLISTLIPPSHLTWFSSNKVVSLSLKWRHPCSITHRFQVCHANGCGFTSHLVASCVFVIVTAYTFQFRRSVFLYIFQNFPNFCFRVSIRLGLPCTRVYYFSTLLLFLYVFLSLCVTATLQAGHTMAWNGR